MLKSLLILLLILNLSFETILYHEILTNENELLLFQPKLENKDISLITIIRPCFNIHCKSNQECVKDPKSTNYICVTKKNNNKSKAKSKEIQNKKCDLIELKLSLFEYFEAFEKGNLKLKSKLKSYSRSIICQESVLIIFNK